MSFVEDFVRELDRDVRPRVQRHLDEVATKGFESAHLKVLDGRLLEIRIVGSQLRFPCAVGPGGVLLVLLGGFKKRGQRWTVGEREQALWRLARHDLWLRKGETR